MTSYSVLIFSAFMEKLVTTYQTTASLKTVTALPVTVTGRIVTQGVEESAVTETVQTVVTETVEATETVTGNETGNEVIVVNVTAGLTVTEGTVTGREREAGERESETGTQRRTRRGPTLRNLQKR